MNRRDRLNALVVNKRRLPALLRNDVPTLRVTNDVRPFIAASENMGVLHHSIGKRIQYDGETAVILNVHENIRLLCTDDRMFWVPRPKFRKQLKRENLLHELRTKIRSNGETRSDIYGEPPVWMGEPRPAGFVSVPLKAIAIHEISEGTQKFLKSMGYPETSLLRITSEETRIMSAFARRNYLRQSIQATVRAKEREIVALVVAEELRRSSMRSNMSDATIAAVYEVLAGEYSLENSAKRRGLKASSLKRTVRTIRARALSEVDRQLHEWIASQRDLREKHGELCESIAESAPSPEGRLHELVCAQPHRVPPPKDYAYVC